MAVEVTQCLDPAKSNGVAGQYANAKAAATSWEALVSLGFGVVMGVLFLLMGLWPFAIAFFFLGVWMYLWLAGANFFDWWLNKRLLCLADDRCAVGIVWATESAEEKR